MEGDPNCKLCRRCDQATNVCILGEDQPSDIMVIGEAPTAKDDERGFLTTSRLLKELLIENEIEPEECFITNAVACYGDKAPTKAQLRQCGYWLNKQIEFCKPKFVLLCGNAALQAITGSPGISKKRGRPFEKDGILYVPTLSMGSAFYDPELRYQISSDIHLLKAIIDNGEIPRETELDFTIVDSDRTLKKLKRALYGTVSVDIETNSLNPWQVFKYVKGKPPVKDPAKIISIGFGTKEGQFIIPVNHIESMWTEDEVAEILDEIKPLLDKCHLVGHNGKFDFLWLWVHFNLILHLDFDTMLAHYLLDENSRHGLKEVARKFCGAPDWDVDMQTKASGDAPLDKHALYLAHDLYYTRKLKFKFKKMLVKDVGVNQVFNYIMMPCARLFTEIEYDGMVIDMEKFDDASKFLHDRYDEHLAALAKWEPKNKKLDRKGKVIRFNWGSPTQLQKLLFDDLGIEPLDYGKSGNPSVSESVLKRIDHPMVGDLLKFREAKQQLSFFIEGWEPYLTRKYINGTWVDILHPRFKLHGTATGRLSSEKPNCQQIPRDKRIRSLITAEPGWTLVECDLSQIELRIAAELANERKLLHYFITGVDVHWSTAIRELERGGGKGDYAKLIKETAGFLLTNVGLSPDLDGAEILLDLWESVKKDSGLYHKLMKAIAGSTPEERWELLDNAPEFEDYVYTARAGAGSNRELDIDFSTSIEVLLCAGPDVPADYNGEWKELRKKAKAVNFGFLFSMFWKKFKMYARDNYGVAITDSQAKDAYDFFFSEYKDLRPWHNEQKKFARKYGYVRSLSGRKRRLPKALLREDTPERRAAERQAINSPVQGFANDINLMTAIQLRKEYGRDVVKICGTVHDAILMRVRNDKVLEVAYRCLEIMRKPELFDTLGIKLTVPIEGEGRIGPWGSGVSLEKWKQP